MVVWIFWQVNLTHLLYWFFEFARKKGPYLLRSLVQLSHVEDKLYIDFIQKAIVLEIFKNLIIIAVDLDE